MGALSAPGTLPCNHTTVVIDKMIRVHELMTQLRALLLPLPPTDRCSKLVRDLFDDIFRSVAMVLSELRPHDSHGKRKNPEEREKNDGLKKRRKQDSWSTFTSIPHIDGHQWRKYGQKQIHNAKFPRSYYKCVYNKDQGCPATKTVQRKNGNDDPPMFGVTYSMQHTCKTEETCSLFVMDSASKKPSPLILESSSSRQHEDPSMSFLAAAQNKNRDQRSTITDFELGEWSGPVTPVDTPGKEDVIADTLSPMDPLDFEIEWTQIDELLGLSEANHFNGGWSL